MAKQAGLYTGGGIVEINETATKQAAVAAITDMNETVVTTAAVTYPQLERGVRGLNRGIGIGRVH